MNLSRVLIQFSDRLVVDAVTKGLFIQFFQTPENRISIFIRYIFLLLDFAYKTLETIKNIKLLFGVLLCFYLFERTTETKNKIFFRNYSLDAILLELSK